MSVPPPRCPRLVIQIKHTHSKKQPKLSIIFQILKIDSILLFTCSTSGWSLMVTTTRIQCFLFSMFFWRLEVPSARRLLQNWDGGPHRPKLSGRQNMADLLRLHLDLYQQVVAPKLLSDLTHRSLSKIATHKSICFLWPGVCLNLFEYVNLA